MADVREAIAALLAVDPLVEGDGEARLLSTMGEDPDGWCGFVSEVVDNYLSDAGFEVVPIAVNTGIPFIGIHYVTLVDGFIVDLTARQLVPDHREDIPFPLILPIDRYCTSLGVSIERDE